MDANNSASLLRAFGPDPPADQDEWNWYRDNIFLIVTEGPAVGSSTTGNDDIMIEAYISSAQLSEPSGSSGPPEPAAAQQSDILDPNEHNSFGIADERHAGNLTASENDMTAHRALEMMLNEGDEDVEMTTVTDLDSPTTDTEGTTANTNGTNAATNGDPTVTDAGAQPVMAVLITDDDVAMWEDPDQACDSCDFQVDEGAELIQCLNCLLYYCMDLICTESDFLPKGFWSCQYCRWKPRIAMDVFLQCRSLMRKRQQKPRNDTTDLSAFLVTPEPGDRPLPRRMVEWAISVERK